MEKAQTSIANSDDSSLDLFHDPLLAVFVAVAGVPVLPTKKCSTNTAVDAVVIGGVKEADQVAAGLSRGGRVW